MEGKKKKDAEKSVVFSILDLQIRKAKGNSLSHS